MAFRFRLQRVLDFVGMKEEAKKQELAEAIRKEQALQEERRKTHERLQSVLNKKDAAGNIELSFSLFRNTKAVLDAKRLAFLEGAIKQAALDLEEKRHQLALASMRRKGLESLRERRLIEYRLDERRKEQKEIDDIFQTSHHRK